MEHLVNFFYKLDMKLEKIKFLEAIKRAFTMLLPIFILGAFSLLMMYFPIKSVRESIEGTTFYDILKLIHFATYGVATLYLIFGITFRYSELFVKNSSTLKLFYVINSFIVYFISLGPKVVSDPAEIIKYLDVKNIFPALIISIVAVTIFRLVFKLITRGRVIPNHTFDTGIWSILPMLSCIVVFGIVAIIFDKIPSIVNFNDLLLDAVARPFKKLGNSYGSGALLTVFESLLWFFGIHGGNALETAKLTAFEFSENEVISKTFLDTFVLMGGCGTILSFAIAVLIASKRKRNKKITYMSLGPMIFNINEITVFGIPFVLNPVYFIPFLLVPLASFTSAYFFISTGIIPNVVNEDVYWTTPVLFSGYMATESIWGSVLQVINLAIGTLIYIPFVKLDNYVNEKSKDRIVKRLTDYVKHCENNGEKTHIFDLDPQLSRIAESIASQMEQDIENGDIIMHYQPLYKDDKIYSMESLLRFKYNDKFLYPPLVVNIAIEKGMFKDLSKSITKRVLHDLESFTDVNINIRASINLQYSLICDRAFLKWFFDTIDLYRIPTSCVGIEITEESSIPSDIDVSKVFEDIRKRGIKMYLDDFSMGKTSITYLQNNKFDYVKLDGSLVKNIDNDRSKDIVQSIIKLGKDLGFDVIAEYVENKQIVDELSKLGCYIYQGYYYSKAVDQENLIILLQDDLARRHREIFDENKKAYKQELKEKKNQYKKPQVSETKKEEKVEEKKEEPKKTTKPSTSKKATEKKPKDETKPKTSTKKTTTKKVEKPEAKDTKKKSTTASKSTSSSKKTSSSKTTKKTTEKK